jgi:hypothetical protein
MGTWLTGGLVEQLLTLVGAVGFFFLAFQALRNLEK